MKKVFKFIGILLLLLIICAIGGITYLNVSFPRVDKAKDIHVEITPQRLARGEYLANYVTGCLDCHSDRDFTKYTAPVLEDTKGKGGMAFDEALVGIPGVIYAKNITPAGIGDWTDGELLRTITTGVNKKGEALFPLMPYMNFRNLCQEDLYSIIAYIRSLKPIQNVIPERNLKVPMNFIVKTIPINAPEKFPDMPAKSDSVAYGAYMTNAVGCINCHTQFDHGKPLPGMEFAGGLKFCFPDGNCVSSANITTDNLTGIGILTKEAFLNKFRFYRSDEAKKIPIGEGGNQSVMPWTAIAQMTDDDLGAIYNYLRTLKPVSNKVEKFSKRS